MKPQFLFPYWFRYLGWGCVLAHIPLAMIGRSHGMVNVMDGSQGESIFSGEHIFFICTTLLMAVGLFFVAFAKEKIEDEQIAQMRLTSLRWAIYLNYLILITSLIFITDTGHILELNLWVPLLFFILHFRWKIYRLNRSMRENARLL